MNNHDPRDHGPRDPGAFDDGPPDQDDTTGVRLVDYHRDEMSPRDRVAFERQLDESATLREQSDEISQILSLFSCLGDRAPGFRTDEVAAPEAAAAWESIEQGCWVMDRLPAYHQARLGGRADASGASELGGADLDRIERAVAESPFLAVESAEIAAALAAWRGACDEQALERFAPAPAAWDELALRLAVHDQLIDYHRGELDAMQCAQVRCAVERSEALGEVSDEIARVVKGVARLGEMTPLASTWDAIAKRLDEPPVPAPGSASTPTAPIAPPTLASRTFGSGVVRPSTSRLPIATWRARLVMVSVLAISVWGVATAWHGSANSGGAHSAARLVAGAVQVESPNGKTSPLLAGQPGWQLEPGDRLVTSDDRARVVLGRPGVAGALAAGVATLVLEAGTDLELLAPGRFHLRRGRIYLVSDGDHLDRGRDAGATGAPRWTVVVADLECRLLGTEVDLELARDRTRVQVIEGRVLVSDSGESRSAGVVRSEREVLAGSGLEVLHAPASGTDAQGQAGLGAAQPFAIEAEHLRTGWQVESLLGRLRVVEERDARGVRRIALLSLTNTTAARVQLVAAGSTRRCWLVIDPHRDEGGGPRGGGAQVPLVLDGPSGAGDALDGGASHTFRIDVTDQFQRRGSYDVRARYLVGRAARDVGSPAHSVTTPAFNMVVE